MGDHAGGTGPKVVHLASSVHRPSSSALREQRCRNLPVEKSPSFSGQKHHSPPVASSSHSPPLTSVAEPDDDDLEALRQREIFHHRQHQLRKLERHRQRPSSAATIRSSGSAFIAKFTRPSSRTAASHQADYSPNISNHDTSLARQISSPGSVSFSTSSGGSTQSAYTSVHRYTEYKPGKASSSRAVASTGRGRSQMEDSDSANHEHLEAAQDVLIWIPESPASGAALRSPVPQRDLPLSHGQLSRSPPSTNASIDAGNSGKRAGLTPCWRKEKQGKDVESSKKTSATPMMMGTWRRGAVSLKENGQFYIFGETRALLHPMLATRLKVTDIRPVDPSLLQRYNVIGIFARPLAIAGTSADCSRIGVRESTTSAVDQAAAATEEPVVYISFPTSHKLQYWTSLLRAYAIPEIYESHSSASAKRSYRWHREIQLRCLDYRPVAPIVADVGKSPSIEQSIWSQDEQEAPGSNSTASSIAERDLSSDEGQGGDSPTFDDAGSASSAGRRRTAELRRQDAPTSLPQGARIDTAGRTTATSVSGHRISSGGGVRRSISVPGESSSRSDHLPATISRSTLLTSVGGKRDQPYSALTAPYEKASANASPKITSPLACFVYLDGVLCAKTTMQPWTPTSPHYHWMEEFEFRDLPNAESLQVDVYQDASSSASSSNKTPNRASSSSHPSGSPSMSSPSASTKVRYSLLGSAEIPLDTFTRGEEVSGWFPLWARRTSTSDRNGLSSASVQDSTSSPYEAHCVGELWLKLKVSEEIVMKRAKYLQVDQALNTPETFEQLLSSLTPHLSETELSSHLVDVYSASTTLVPRLVQLGQHHDFGAHNPDLLLRSGNVMSRLVVTIALRYGQDWLRECLYPTLLKVCEEGQSIDVDALNWFDTSGASPAPHSDRVASRQQGTAPTSHHLFVYINNTSPYALAAVDDGRIQDGKLALEGKAALDRLRLLLNRLWKNIYESRHRCPTELRQVLASIRRTVYDQFILTSTPKVAIAAGLQSLGSLVFLRFFCPAIAAPNEYGLMLHAPDTRAKKTLATLSKVLLKLHNKMAGSDQQRMGGWMKELSAFWKEEASAYDDFVTAISTSPDVPPTSSRFSGKSRRAQATPLFPQLDEQDQIVHTMVARRMNSLPYTLHREMLAADPPGLRMGDQALPFARLVSLIVSTIDAGALAKQQDEKASEPKAGGNNLRTEFKTLEAAQEGSGTSSPQPLSTAPTKSDGVKIEPSDDQQILQNFVDVCQSVAEKATSLVDQAGSFPSPVEAAVLASPRTKSSVISAEDRRESPSLNNPTSPSPSSVGLAESSPVGSSSPVTIVSAVPMSPLEQLPSRTETLRPKKSSEVQELPATFTRTVSVDGGNDISDGQDSTRPRSSDSVSPLDVLKPKILRRTPPGQVIKSTPKPQGSSAAERPPSSRAARSSSNASSQPALEKSQTAVPSVTSSKSPSYVLHTVEAGVEKVASIARPLGPMSRRSTTSVHTSSTLSDVSGEESSGKRGSKWWRRG